MKPMSSEAVKRFALSRGGKLEIDGKAVNSARLQVVTQAKPSAPSPAYMPDKPAPAPAATIQAPAPDPAVKEAVLAIDRYASSNFLFNEANVQMMTGIKDVLQKVSAQEPEKRPTKWVFSVKRDSRGLMESITATAQFK